MAITGYFMSIPKLKLLIPAVLVHAIAAGIAFSQSTDQNFPTPVTSNEIRGAINARAMGDGRSTSYYYIFDGKQGDIFVNVVTRNFSGDIDIFVADGLRPITKIVAFADLEEAETGRVIYLRKPERLVLRVQGRTPNDEPAEFRLKFAGSFLAVDADSMPAAPDEPKVIRVSDANALERAEKARLSETAAAREPQGDGANRSSDSAPETRPVRRGSSTLPGSRTAADPSKQSTGAPRSAAGTRAIRPRQAPAESERAASTADPMAAFRLVVIFKNGDRLERPMGEILRFSVDSGVLQILSRDGKFSRYSMAEIDRIAIE